MVVELGKRGALDLLLRLGRHRGPDEIAGAYWREGRREVGGIDRTCTTLCGLSSLLGLGLLLAGFVDE